MLRFSAGAGYFKDHNRSVRPDRSPTRLFCCNRGPRKAVSDVRPEREREQSLVSARQLYRAASLRRRSLSEPEAPPIKTLLELVAETIVACIDSFTPQV